MTDNNKKPFDPVVPVEGEPKEDSNNTGNTRSGLALASGGNNKIIIAVVSLILSVVIYFAMFSSKDEEGKIDNREILESDKNASISKIEKNKIEDLSGLIKIDYNDSDLNDENNEKLLEAPTLPSLPDNIKLNIEEEVKEIKKQKSNDEVFTKKEVDDMINTKLKTFETEMKKVKDESERLAKEIQKQKILEEEENKKAKRSVIPSILVPNDNGIPQLNGEIIDNKSSLDLAISEEEKLRQENEQKELQKSQRARVLNERKSLGMFKLKGGDGGGDSTTVDQNSIIITNKDSLQTVSDTADTTQTTKIPDLSRTLLQGKIINAILETAINTDVGSQVRAIVSRDIYSETNKNILIPKGSKLIGTFSAAGIGNGVSRVTITWSRLIRVDGLNLTLTADTADDLGRGGIDGQLDSKYVSRIKNSLLSSAVTIAASLLSEKITGSVGISNATTVGTDSTSTIQTSGKVSDYAIVEAVQNFTDDMQDLVDNLKEESPTIRIAQGTKMNVVVNQDLILPIYKQKQ